MKPIFSEHSVDTIAAIATATGQAGIGIIRISGPAVPNMFLPLLGSSLKPRVATHKDFLAEDGAAIDTGLALYFPSPASFTGEDVLELQGHGGMLVLQHLLKRCLALGTRLAQPGEFTRRAVLNDKLDLAQAESIIDLINAQSEAAIKNAMRSLKGDFSEKINQLVQDITTLRAMIEATFDFAEEDIDLLSHTQIQHDIKVLQTQLRSIKASAQQGAMLRNGAHIVLIGAPNVGKSSLLNVLANDDIAIVNEIPGTTRDALREMILVEGIPLHIIDTAGLRYTEDELEKAGIVRTWSAIHQADVALILIDRRYGLTEETQALLKDLPQNLLRIKVYNKIDLTDEKPLIFQEEKDPAILLSAKHRWGIDLLRKQLLLCIGWHGSHEGLFLARERHLEAIFEATQYVDEAAAPGNPLELAAESLRLAQNALNLITKAVSSEDLLDQIFSTFCIGK